MKMQMLRRLTTLEQRRVVAGVRWRRVVVRTDEEADAARPALLPGEGLILRWIVSKTGADDGG